jgi:hypothetical protein
MRLLQQVTVRYRRLRTTARLTLGRHTTRPRGTPRRMLCWMSKTTSLKEKNTHDMVAPLRETMLERPIGCDIRCSNMEVTCIPRHRGSFFV